jgi:hypothetical protein
MSCLPCMVSQGVDVHPLPRDGLSLLVSVSVSGLDMGGFSRLRARDGFQVPKTRSWAISTGGLLQMNW